MSGICIRLSENIRKAELHVLFNVNVKLFASLCTGKFKKMYVCITLKCAFSGRANYRSSTAKRPGHEKIATYLVPSLAAYL